ncbi:tRNA lysidine(34) synthetase TilS [Ferruginibacter albus]|uniref:tRNA lysidine(34) synthetase TilS n=1 Tax=Ferruginibacter albus TaxID=2875540 RepID=UPI001CC7F7DF|nr:tRNA lysidine(34) synthetase TilS [Ferruginibacter albus]UAY53173.1 tRNA lysidine(34) synthetase TilS [Ferruginibacter albus]
MDLLKEFKDYIKKEDLFQPKDKLLLAVSGGVDSVVLCELCKQAGYDFTIAHCNFQLRGEESERDEQFVRNLATTYNVEVFIKKFDTNKYVAETKAGVQEAARELRYSWFKEIINGASSFLYLVTAHHANDNIETVLMNFFKGTGISGLHGILPKHNKIIRPLLFATKDEIKAFAKENDLSFVEDSSNTSNKYTRNYFRNQLIPDLQKTFPQVEKNLIDNIERFKDVELLYQQSIDLHKKKLVEKKGNEFHIPVLKLLQSKPLATIIYEIIKDFGFSSQQVNEIIALLQSESGKYVQSSSYRIIKNRNWLIVSPNKTEEAGNILIEECDKRIVFQNGALEINKILNTQYSIINSQLTAQLDASEVQFPLLLRKWKQGDYFYPLGMKKKKKLSRFFIDQKLSLTDKEKVWVLESNKRIVWIVGLRIDDRFKIIPSTENVLQVNLISQ